MGLWKLDGGRSHFDAAVQEAKQAVEHGCPPGTDIVARFCLTREAFRADDADPADVIGRFAKANGDETTATTALAVASLLALDVGDRRLHEHCRRASLDKHANTPALWTATAYLLDRYHRYWMYHPPFTAGWTYGRRMGHFLATGEPEDANRTLRVELKTLEGKAFRIPEDTGDKWTVLEFTPSAEGSRHLQRYGAFIKDRPYKDVNLFAVVLNEDADAPNNWKPKPISTPHLRSRAKVYVAIEEWDAALADAEQVYLAVNSKAGWLSMRTAEIEEAEKLKATIISAQGKLSER